MNEKPEVSAKEFGALWANVEHIKESVDRHTTTLERIENIARTNVTQAQLAQHEKESEEKERPQKGYNINKRRSEEN